MVAHSVSRSLGLAALLAVAFVPASAMAARDPAYAAARSAGQIGEKPDGYLGVVSGGGSVSSIVDDINIKRRAAYTQEARTQSVTVDQVAFVAGCRNILRTVAGEKYQAPDGSWMTRTSAPPVRDSRCP
ncbi:MAG: YdbL family protein [Novosphingobium sp.]|nr:YdbL family protein [Novosphingobium sp.]